MTSSDDKWSKSVLRTEDQIRHFIADVRAAVADRKSTQYSVSIIVSQGQVSFLWQPVPDEACRIGG